MRWFGRLAELIEDWVSLVQRDGWRSAWPEVGRAIVTLPYRRIEFIRIGRWRRVRYRRREDIE
jgi:hypothetical protein